MVVLRTSKSVNVFTPDFGTALDAVVKEKLWPSRVRSLTTFKSTITSIDVTPRKFYTTGFGLI